jgi:hypothetical protein
MRKERLKTLGDATRRRGTDKRALETPTNIYFTTVIGTIKRYDRVMNLIDEGEKAKKAYDKDIKEKNYSWKVK